MKNVPYKSPAVSLPRDGGEMLSLTDLRPKNVVLFFYPRDATPTCTKEAVSFSQSKEDFDGKAIQVSDAFLSIKLTFILASATLVRSIFLVRVHPLPFLEAPLL